MATRAAAGSVTGSVPSPPSPWRRVPADPARWFDTAVIRRGRAYSRPLDRLGVLRAVLAGAVTLAFIGGQVGPRVAEAVDGWAGGWVVQLAVVAAAFEVAGAAVGAWFGAHRSLVHDRRWGVSTQTGGGWLLDELKGLAVGYVLTLVVVVPLFAVIRATEWWWLYGWLLLSALTVAFGFLWPVLIAPVFNRFTPLADAALAERLRALAARAGLDVSQVLVADASRRTRATNAYVAGLGRTRRVVLFDTILRWPPEEIEQVVAHELGHWRHRHVARQVPLLVAVHLVMLGTAWLLLRWEPLLEWAGVARVGEPGALPLLLAVLPLSLVVVNLALAWVSRAYERQADVHALALLERPQEFVAAFRRLAEEHRADVDPSWWKRVRATHPPIAERMEMAGGWPGGEGPGPASPAATSWPEGGTGRSLPSTG